MLFLPTQARTIKAPFFLFLHSQSLQKPVEDRSRIGCFRNQKRRGKEARENDRSLPHQSSTLYLKYLKGGYRLFRAQQNKPSHFTFSRRNVLSNNSIVTPSSPKATVNHERHVHASLNNYSILSKIKQSASNKLHDSFCLVSVSVFCSVKNHKSHAAQLPAFNQDFKGALKFFF